MTIEVTERGDCNAPAAVRPCVEETPSVGAQPTALPSGETKCTCGRTYHAESCPAFQRFESAPKDFVGISDAHLVYIGVADRAKFDALDLPLTDTGPDVNGHVLTKRMGDFGRKGVTVVFQFWLVQKTVAAIIADNDKARRAEVRRG